jgi:formylglycine-generating enzyme required for sulfatase activity
LAKAVIILLILFVVSSAGTQQSDKPVAGAEKLSNSKTATKPAEYKGPDKSKMVYIPAGNFIMGSKIENSDEYPEHTVYLNAFEIDKCEVTNARYNAFINSGGYSERKYWTLEGWKYIAINNITKPQWWDSGKYHSGPRYPDYPVTGISWFEACAFAKWAGKRLPTEAEWEKAARGIDGKTYPWGEEINSSKANYNNGVGASRSVGSYLSGESPYGCLDMAGNVWEWCNDWYDGNYYSVSPAKSPAGPETGHVKVIRGGSWIVVDNVLRCAYRTYFILGTRDYFIGFRCVR